MTFDVRIVSLCISDYVNYKPQLRYNVELKAALKATFSLLKQIYNIELGKYIDILCKKYILNTSINRYVII